MAFVTALLGGLTVVVPAAAAAADEDPGPALRVVRHDRTAAQKQADGTVAYTVPSGSAGLSRITTAPNGDMWFVERNAQPHDSGYIGILGQIKPNGAITEWGLGAENQYSTVKDVDVAADGKVWVLYNSGRHVLGFYPGQGGTGSTNVALDALPRGQQLRIGPDGVTPWITLGYDTHGIARVVNGSVQTSYNPACENQISRGAQGTMWCTTDVQTNVKRISADGSSTQAYPLPADATYPYSIAAGPTGAIWFGRDNGCSTFCSPGNGSVGWFDLGNSGAHVIPVGSKVAPRALKLGPDGNIWFASIGITKAIGHVNAAGLGAVTQVGSWQPRGLTFSNDGALWFTDDVNNSIVRVPLSALQTTNVDVGTGSTMKGRTVALKKVRKKGAKRVFAGTVSAASPSCTAGKVQVRRVKGKKSVVVAKGKAKASGKYKVSVRKAKLPKGKYFVRAKAGAGCPAADSPARKVK
ncbi:virginiamycin B lyase family protein [Nocardioides humi]|uniref:Vgb family protein n=1 Tax=Nocardioides humi TaxID=449461 RepID=UPI0011264FD5|nr:hypothetical protein [Nocardioides humi]